MLHRALKMLRSFHDLTQSEVAERVGVSKSYVSEIEAGNRSPSLEVLQAYSIAFRMPLSSILLFSEGLDNPASGKGLRAKIPEKVIKLLEYIDARSREEESL